jgi:hypothetical protein
MCRLLLDAGLLWYLNSVYSNGWQFSPYTPEGRTFDLHVFPNIKFDTFEGPFLEVIVYCLTSRFFVHRWLESGRTRGSAFCRLRIEVTFAPKCDCLCRPPSFEHR